MNLTYKRYFFHWSTIYQCKSLLFDERDSIYQIICCVLLGIQNDIDLVQWIVHRAFNWNYQRLFRAIMSTHWILMAFVFLCMSIRSYTPAPLNSFLIDFQSDVVNRSTPSWLIALMTQSRAHYRCVHWDILGRLECIISTKAFYFCSTGKKRSRIKSSTINHRCNSM